MTCVEPSPRRNSTISDKCAGHSQRPATFPERFVLLNKLAGIVREDIGEDNVFQNKLPGRNLLARTSGGRGIPRTKIHLQQNVPGSHAACEIVTCNPPAGQLYWFAQNKRRGMCAGMGV